MDGRVGYGSDKTHFPFLRRALIFVSFTVCAHTEPPAKEWDRRL